MIVVRAATGDDAPAIVGIYGPYVASSAVSFETEAPTPDDMRGRIGGSDGLYPWLVAHHDDDGVVLGFAYAGQFRARAAYRWTVETGAYVAGNIVGQGVGRLLYASLIATLEVQDFTQAVASIALPNDHSITMHEAVGFRRAGVYRSVGYKHGQWRDVGIWQRDLAASHSPPEEPKRFADVGVVRDN